MMKRKKVTTNAESISSYPDRRSSNDIHNSIDITTINRFMYMIVTALCIMMVFWILVFPSSVWYEHSTIHRQLLHELEYGGGNIGMLLGTVTNRIQGEALLGSVSFDLISKYQRQYMVQMTHILPSAIWAVLIPFQLNTTLRKKRPTLHRYIGYTFVAVAVLVGLGVFVILHKGLLYENFFEDLPPKSITVAPLIILMAIYFIGSILTAIYHVAFVTPRNYDEHSIWITRHIASGIWIAVQRILLGSPIFNRPPMTREQQREVFGNAGILAVIITTLCGECLIHLWRYNNQSTNISTISKGKQV